MLVNIERLGDEAVNIAERVLVLTSESRQPIHGNLRHLAGLALDLARESIRCYMDLDTATALQVIDQNTSALELNVRVFREVTGDMPVAGALGQIKGATIGFLSLFALGLAVFYLTIQVFFDRLVVVNLRRTTAVMGLLTTSFRPPTLSG